MHEQTDLLLFHSVEKKKKKESPRAVNGLLDSEFSRNGPIGSCSVSVAAAAAPAYAYSGAYAALSDVSSTDTLKRVESQRSYPYP